MSIEAQASTQQTEPIARMKRIGVIRLEVLKRMAGLLKKSAGIKHSHALQKLARACGYAHYHKLHMLVTQGQPPISRKRDVPDEQLLALWQSQLIELFGKAVVEDLGADWVETWFRRVFVMDSDDPNERSDHVHDQPHIQDPALRANDWRDAEFRDWVHRQLQRQRPTRRE